MNKLRKQLIGGLILELFWALLCFVEYHIAVVSTAIILIAIFIFGIGLIIEEI